MPSTDLNDHLPKLNDWDTLLEAKTGWVVLMREVVDKSDTSEWSALDVADFGVGPLAEGIEDTEEDDEEEFTHQGCKNGALFMHIWDEAL